MELKYWQHPADEDKILKADEHKDQTIHAYTDGSKTRKGVRSGVALYIETELALQEKFKLDTRCSNNPSRPVGNHQGSRNHRNNLHPTGHPILLLYSLTVGSPQTQEGIPKTIATSSRK